MPECVSCTSSRGSRCQFLRLLRNMSAIVSKYMKKPSTRRAPPAAMSLCSRVRASPCFAPVLGRFCLRRGPSPCPVCVLPAFGRSLSVLCFLSLREPSPPWAEAPDSVAPLSLMSNVLSPCGQDAPLAQTAVSLLIVPCVAPTLSLTRLASNG